MDNHHVNIQPSSCSCGVLALSGLTADAKKMLYAISSYLYHPSRGRPAAFLIWSDIDKDGSNGDGLYEYISEVIDYSQSSMGYSRAENPITSNDIRLYYWPIQHEQLKEWYQQQRIERAKL